MNIEDYKRWKDGDNDVFFIPEQYFSGADTNLYINNKHVIDVSNIVVSLRQNLKPIYGYKSFTYDAMAVGNRIIVGEFLIPFIKKGYLLNFFTTMESDSKTQEESNDVGTPNDKATEYLRRRGILNNEEITEGGGIDRKNTHGYDSGGFSPEDRIRLSKHGFDICISYGVRTTQQVADMYSTNEFSKDNSVDSVLLKGVEIISGIHLRGHDKTITFNDTIYEKYEFIAKDIL